MTFGCLFTFYETIFFKTVVLFVDVNSRKIHLYLHLYSP